MATPPRRPFRATILCLMVAGALVLWFKTRRQISHVNNSANPAVQVSPELVERLTSLEARERKIEETVWGPELLAQEHGRVFENLWDALNHATNKLELLATWPAGVIVLPKFQSPKTFPPAIELREPTGPGGAYGTNEWRSFLQQRIAEGWQLIQCEFRHVHFHPASSTNTPRSHFQFSAHLANSIRESRAVLEGRLIVEWSSARDADGQPSVQRIDASDLLLKTRAGEAPFRSLLSQSVTPPEGSYFIDPLILHDLDGDGLPEIILASKNTVYHRVAQDRFVTRPLCRDDPGVIFTGLIGDFDGDGVADFLCAKFGGLFLYKGTRDGKFDEPPRQVWKIEPHLKYAQVLTCGDVDGDGDLDIWLGQYKVPYTRGQIPTPYYDANDGYPAYLLLNDGNGSFQDATDSSGLGEKRFRRTYSASLVDLDHDGNLDLMVVSDFAGTDLYRNDGRGHFSDVTAHWLDDPHAAGMAHAIADFNRDGLIDLLVIGMHSPTVDRLDALGLARPGSANDAAMRARLMHGNRLYLGQTEGGFRESALSASLARSGWSWGGSAFDLDNDGYPDVYVANGHESKESVRDYESEAWLHDYYVGTSNDDLILTAYFSGKMTRTRGRGYSFGGYEKNRLFLNQRGTSFLEAGFLMGVALEQDCRDVVSADLDGDGRMDLLVTTFEAWPVPKQTLHVFKNILAQTGNWIGIRFKSEPGDISPVGSQVTLYSGAEAATRPVITGDSYRSQHSNTVHFGLGAADHVDRLDIRWPGGRTQTLSGLAVNRYHEVRTPRVRDSR